MRRCAASARPPAGSPLHRCTDLHDVAQCIYTPCGNRGLQKSDVELSSATCASVRSKLSVCLLQSSDDHALGDLVLAFEALGVDAEQDLDAVASPFGDLGWGYSPVEPGGQAGMAEIIGSAG